jgi:hypothetical protein
MVTMNKSGYAPVNGLKMYYEIYGDGAIPLVLIHGADQLLKLLSEPFFRYFPVMVN